MKRTSHSVTETMNLGQQLGKQLAGGEFMTLIGDLGGGKTHFTKGLAQGLEIQEEITSPTFVLERIYESPQGLNLHHFDFYRLGTFDPEIQADIFDLISSKENIVVVEWANNIPDTIPNEHLEISFVYLGDETREIVITGFGDRYQKLIKDLK